ncbi:N-acetylmuramoyl-L-alanine amidase [Ignatzschineria larvae DSM 13226]|uniref:N-acetylmuramoyl-L-alanine amidase n=1 Tax=Ignatzschineria larvae DSM 13226 TaxID=1111732 RepID=A0ABZ3C1R5_9GAMM|nr:N-acetylmuramoyl-L-alanine amidase [Ignatzschineria larvae]
MREINKIIVHCSATKPDQDFSVHDIRSWHKNQGWSDVGYHYIVRLDGSIEKGRPLEKTGAHVKGHNADSIGVCYIGGVDEAGKPKDTRTEAQKESLDQLLTFLAYRFNAPISGHNDYTNMKACPSFKAKEQYEYINYRLVHLDELMK